VDRIHSEEWVEWEDFNSKEIVQVEVVGHVEDQIILHSICEE